MQELHNGRSTGYSYDELYRLVGETVTDPVNGGYSAEYQYDKVGNRSYSIVDGVHTAYSYDANGNTLTETEDGQVTRYTYDARNKLVETTRPGYSASYGYNADGIRTRRTENGATTQFVVDSNRDYAQVIAELDSTDNVLVSYTYGHDLISQNRSGATSYYLYDGLGSTRALSDDTGTIVDKYYYEAFGEILAQSGTTENKYLYAGEQFDSQLDQYYLRARYLDPAIGRFTQMDSFEGIPNVPLSLNKYSYAHNDVPNEIDPSGHFISSLSTAQSIGVILATTYVGYEIGQSLAGSSFGSSLEDATNSINEVLWNMVATMQFNAKVSGAVTSTTTTTPRRERSPNDRHHTIPIYLCGAPDQELASVLRSEHRALHAGLALIEVAKISAEEAADRLVPFTRRRSGPVMDIAESKAGRGAIAAAIQGYYHVGGWWSKGTPTIGSVFTNEKPRYIDGHTSLPTCSRR